MLLFAIEFNSMMLLNSARHVQPAIKLVHHESQRNIWNDILIETIAGWDNKV